MLADPGVDAAIVLFVPPIVAGAEEIATAVGRGQARGRQANFTSLIAEGEPRDAGTDELSVPRVGRARTWARRRAPTGFAAPLVGAVARGCTDVRAGVKSSRTHSKPATISGSVPTR